MEVNMQSHLLMWTNQIFGKDAIFENFVLTYGPMKAFISDMDAEYKNSILMNFATY